MNSNPLKTYFVEYSNNQVCYHITTLDDILESNQRIVTMGLKDANHPGYIIVGGPFESIEQASAFRKIHELARTGVKRD